MKNEPRIFQSSLRTKLEHMAVHDAVMKRKIKEKGAQPIGPAPFHFPPTILAYQVRNTCTNENLGEEFAPNEYDQAKQSLKECRESWEQEGGGFDEIALFAVIDA